ADEDDPQPRHAATVDPRTPTPECGQSGSESYCYPMRSSLFRRSTALLGDLRVRLGLSVAAVAALATGLALLCVAVVGVGEVTEDVTRHSGLVRSDLVHLRWFTHQRSDALITLSRLLSEIGSVVVLGAVAVLAGFLLWRRGLPLLLALAPALAL